MHASRPESNDSHLEAVRRHEIGMVRPWFQSGAKVLELGGNTGFHAAILASWGCEVTSLDVAVASGPALRTYYPVQVYDGRHIPAPDAAFEVVYSSHMLCYVLDQPEFLAEIRRVVAPGGLGIHLMPSSAWWLQNFATHYPWVLLHSGRIVWRRLFARRQAEDAAAVSAAAAKGWAQLLRLAVRNVVPAPLGPSPNFLCEAWQWRRRHVAEVLQRAGFETLAVVPLRMLYTPHELLAQRLSLETRRRLAALLGSSSTAFVTRKPTAGDINPTNK